MTGVYYLLPLLLPTATPYIAYSLLLLLLSLLLLLLLLIVHPDLEV